MREGSGRKEGREERNENAWKRRNEREKKKGKNQEGKGGKSLDALW